MDEPIKKRVDESWKEQAEREKRVPAPGPAAPGQDPKPSEPSPVAPARPEPSAVAGGGEEIPEARFDMFVSGMAMEALIALGDMANPATRRQAANLPQAKYLIDLLGVLEEKTRGNLAAEEQKLLSDALYQLRMRYLAKTGG